MIGAMPDTSPTPQERRAAVERVYTSAAEIVAALERAAGRLRVEIDAARRELEHTAS